MKSRNLNFLESSGPLQACNGTDLTFTFTFVFQSVCFMCISCAPSRQLHACVLQASQGKKGVQSVQNFLKFSYSFFVRCIILNYMHTNKTVELHDNKPCYVMVLSRRNEKHFFKEGNRPAMFLITSISSYGHVLKKIIFRKNFNE